MLDNALIELFSDRLVSASAAAGWNYPVVQKQQPTQQGIPTEPTIFFEKLFDNAYGYAAYSNSVVVTDDLPQMFETDNQLMETVFQVSAWVIQNPDDLSIPTASDVLNYVNMYLRTRQTQRTWIGLGVNILRVTQLRNPYTEDDRHRNEATPSFDIVVTHSRTITVDVDSADHADGELHVVG